MHLAIMGRRIRRTVMLLGFAFLLPGCGDSSKPSAQSTNTQQSSSSPLTAPVDYLGAIGKAQKTAVKTVDLASVGKAIQMFQVENDRYPNNLDELIEEKYLPRLPELPSDMKYAYDSKTGVVRAVKR